MQPEIGELFVGAYLRVWYECPIVQYNVRDPKEGALGEIDVLGINYEKDELYVCEVVTHLDGALYPSYDGKTHRDGTVERLRSKFERDRRFVQHAFSSFEAPVFMLWSPRVAVGKKTEELARMAEDWPGPGSLDLRINGAYTEAMRTLIREAGSESKQRGEFFYRALQLLTHLRTNDNRRATLHLR